MRAALKVVHELLRRGADPNTRRHGGTVLNHALRLKQAPLVQRLLREGAYPHPPPKDSAARGAVELAAFARGNGFGDEAIHCMRRALWAAGKADDQRTLRGLLVHGCPAEKELLFTLVRQRRSLACIQALLRFRADPNVADSLGTHVLTIAALQGEASVQVVRSLLHAGADPLRPEGSEGSSILEVARGQELAPEVTRLMEEYAERAQARSRAA